MLELAGCAPDIAMMHLKALGILKVVALQKDESSMSWWKDGKFMLDTGMSRNDLVEFFRTEYSPMPVVSPWNRGSPFRKSSTDLDRLASSDEERLSQYRATIEKTRSVMEDFGMEKLEAENVPKGTNKQKYEKRQKDLLIMKLMNELPDSALPWLETAYAIESEYETKVGPILGSGGNDGKTELSEKFTNIVSSHVLGADPDLISQSVFGGDMGLLDQKVAFLDPGAYKSSSTSFAGKQVSASNPWDMLLALEGAVLFAGTVLRRGTGRHAAFPFTLESLWAGYGTATIKEQKDDHGEIWFPMWESPASYDEIRHIFREGMVQTGNIVPSSGLDFAIALANLGAVRGISQFQRFGIFERKGRERHMVSVGVHPIKQDERSKKHMELVTSADEWLRTIRAAQRRDSKAFPETLAKMVLQAGGVVMDYCSSRSASVLMNLLVALGRIELHPYIRNPYIEPLKLDPGWVSMYRDRVEMRLATALASMNYKEVGRIRQNINHIKISKYGKVEWDSESPTVVWGHGDLINNMIAVLERRHIDALRTESTKSGPRAALYGVHIAQPADILCFLEGKTDDSLIGDLVAALSCVPPTEMPEDVGPFMTDSMPEAYVCLKANFPPVQPSQESEAVFESSVLAMAKSGNVARAMQTIRRRLRISGYSLVTDDPSHSHSLGRNLSRRVLASMLFPIENRKYRNSWEKLAKRSGLLKSMPEDQNESDG